MAKKKRYGLKPRALPIVSFKELEDYYNNRPPSINLSDMVFENIGTEQANMEMMQNAQQQKQPAQKEKKYPRVDYLEPIPARKIGGKS